MASLYDYNLNKEKALHLLSCISRDDFEKMDEELLNIIQVFFRNHLNIAKSAHQLYVHRNTLIYRIEKIMSIIGLDIRDFDDAVKMELLLLLKKRFYS